MVIKDTYSYIANKNHICIYSTIFINIARERERKKKKRERYIHGELFGSPSLYVIATSLRREIAMEVKYVIPQLPNRSKPRPFYTIYIYRYIYISSHEWRVSHEEGKHIHE